MDALIKNVPEPVASFPHVRRLTEPHCYLYSGGMVKKAMRNIFTMKQMAITLYPDQQFFFRVPEFLNHGTLFSMENAIKPSRVLWWRQMGSPSRAFSNDVIVTAEVQRLKETDEGAQVLPLLARFSPAQPELNSCQCSHFLWSVVLPFPLHGCAAMQLTGKAAQDHDQERTTAVLEKNQRSF
ncbi:hypothetical protein lerEdw1_016140 [Lerista edwardsae]|nr:hypothetical protein lerEdw1_016140 [Lerista edwardsae]